MTKPKARNPVSKKISLKEIAVKEVTDMPEETTVATVDTAQTEIDRLHSVLEQVDADITAGQLVTAHARIKAALAHGQEPEVEPLK